MGKYEGGEVDNHSKKVKDVGLLIQARDHKFKRCMNTYTISFFLRFECCQTLLQTLYDKFVVVLVENPSIVFIF